MTRRRLLPFVLTVVLLAAVGLSGCIAIKTESASTPRAPGVVTISLSVCASHRVANSNCIPSPDATPGQTINTAEGDDGQDAPTPDPDPNDPPFKGQILAGFRLPIGTTGPSQFTASTGELFTASQGYANALNRDIAPPTGFRWVGYISSSVTLTAGSALTSFDVEFNLPAGAGGAPFSGPFQWRAIIGLVGVGVDPGTCDAGSICYESPQPANLVTQFNQNVSDFRVLPGTGATAAPGQTATLSFPVRYTDNATPKFNSQTFKLTGSSTLPGSPAVTPATPNLTMAPGATPTVNETVTVPAGTPPGNYPVTLTAADGTTNPVTRSNTATLTVVDKTAPSIAIGSPTDGEVLTVGQQIAATYSCADEAGGSGLASCAGPVANGAPIDTSSPGQKTFTVSAADKAGNAASLTRTYTVVPPPVATQRKAINFSLSFLFSASRNSTRFSALAVKGVPSGSTVTVKCQGHGCPKKSFTKKKAKGSVSLKPYVKKALPKGLKLTVTVTKPGFVSMIKTVTIRSSHAPKIVTTCRAPGAKKATRC